MRTKVISIVLTLLLTSFVVLAFRGWPYFVNLVEDFRGYDYGPKMAAGYDWIGPKPGEVIDFEKLITEDGVPLTRASHAGLVLLTVVDPDCGACRQSRGQFAFLNDKAAENQIDYFVVSFSPKLTSSDLSEYVRSLGLNARSLVWTNGLENQLPSIKAIAYPTHILADSEGYVIGSFPGTSGDKRVRDRMVQEVFRHVMIVKNRRM